MSARRGAVAVALAALAGLVALAGCQRKVTLATDGADTTAVVSSDSLESLLAEVVRAWEGGADDDAAARLTANALYADFTRRDPSQHRARAEELLDSLGVGAEITGDRCALVVNLFVRSDPTRGSWPFLFWCLPSGLRMQELEGKGMKLVASETLADPEGTGPTPGRIAALYTRTRNGRPEPLVFVWGRGPKADDWSVVQTLGPDSLGGYGTGAFEKEGGVVDLVTLTYRPLPRFDECATCPHVLTTHRFRWEMSGFTRLNSVPMPSPYGTFVRFVDALTQGREDASQYVAALTVLEQARALEWDRPKGTWRVAPGTDATETGEMRIFRGSQETYQVAFESRGPDWVISGIELASRTVE